MTARLTSEEMKGWSRLVYELCGVHLDESKAYLIESRLARMYRESGGSGWGALLAKVKIDPSLRNQVISAVTTNETSFFRDTSPFELLRHKLLPELIDRRNAAGRKPVPIRILSAACSTGQEAYSTAMVLKELLTSFMGYDIRIFGLDVSDEAVAKASYGHYSNLEIGRGLKPDQISRYFVAAGKEWKVQDELRALVTFRKGNLLEPIPASFPYDIIFCRNVAIYFTEQDKVRLFSGLGKVLAPDGALIIGSTESITGLCPEFEPKRYLRSVFYRKR